MDVDFGGSIPAIFLGLIVLGVVAYVVLRSVEAGNRGESRAGAAADALRDVGPPALVAGVGVVVAVVLICFAGLLFVIGLIEAIFRNDGDSLAGAFVMMGLSGLVLFGAGGGALYWAISRVRRRRS